MIPSGELFATHRQLAMGALWVAIALLTATLSVMTWTQWGQARPLRKCILLSVLAHLLLAGYAASVSVLSGAKGFGGGGDRTIQVSLLDDDSGDVDPEGDVLEDQAPSENPEEAKTESPPEGEAPDSELPEASESTEPQVTSPGAPDRADARSDAARHSPLNREPAERALDRLDYVGRNSKIDLTSPPPAEEASSAILDPTSSRTVAESPRQARPTDTRHELDSPAKNPLRNASRPTTKSAAAPPTELPASYRLRNVANRGRVARSRGGSLETERVVDASLEWLAANQDDDGRWNANAFGAGHDRHVEGKRHRRVGGNSDTAVTGLALLAFLGAGHTHLEGDHRETVERGLRFLVSVQSEEDGNLAAEAEPFSRMYCHGMAAFAMSEALAMTSDDAFREPVARAIGYSVRAQDRANSGGWRYRPGEAGDTSQLGWQLMAIKSADLAGVRLDPATRAGMIDFLGQVAAGASGGLASYRPNQQPTRTMTAEALVCREFLGVSDEDAAAEASDYIVRELPGEGPDNVYFWYYATLGLYQLQDENWRTWNKAMTSQLVRTQHSEGALAGSWDPDAVYGQFGGRVYATALSALCLEVYYRYLPLLANSPARGSNAQDARLR